MSHRVTIRLHYVGGNEPTGPRSKTRTTPWKWWGICTCGWRCLSWFWRHPDDPEGGALPMSLNHLHEGAT